MTPRVLEKIAEIMDRAPAARRTVLALILEDPQRVLDETFETLAQRANSSVPTIMRTCLLYTSTWWCSSMRCATRWCPS